jgi:hypothetical protein
MTIKTEPNKPSRQIVIFLLKVLVLGILFKIFYFTYWNLLFELGGVYYIHKILIKDSLVFWFDVLLPGIALIFSAVTVACLYILYKREKHKVNLLILAIQIIVFIYFLNDWYLFF